MSAFCCLDNFRAVYQWKLILMLVFEEQVRDKLKNKENGLRNPLFIVLTSSKRLCVSNKLYHCTYSMIGANRQLCTIHYLPSRFKSSSLHDFNCCFYCFTYFKFFNLLCKQNLLQFRHSLDSDQTCFWQ